MPCASMNDIAIGILAGGASSRMGRDKAGLKLQSEQTLLEYMLNKYKAYFVFSSCHSTSHIQAWDRYQHPMVPDFFDSRLGPVAGIISSITWLKNTCPNIKQCIFIPVDLAYFSTKDVAKMITAEYSVAYFKESPLPLKIEISSIVLEVCQGIMSELQEMGGYSVYRFIQQFKSRAELVNDNPKILTNINYISDWNIFLNEYMLTSKINSS